MKTKLKLERLNGILRSIAILGIFIIPIIIMPTETYAQSLREAFKEVDASVVEIRTRQRGYENEGGTVTPSVGGIGSGVLISPTRVLTASHVVDIADEITVVLVDGQERRASVLSSEPSADVSVLTLDEPVTQFEPARLGNSDAVEIGEEVFVIGTPYGLSHSLTVGFISGKHQPSRGDGLFPLEVLQTDAAINPGSSGGPLFNYDGEVIGIVSRIASRSGGFEGLGFAVSINTAKSLVVEQRSFWSGLQYVLLPPTLAEALNVPQRTGMLVQRVARGSPADAIGLRSGNLLVQYRGEDVLIGGDVILAVNHVPIDSPQSVRDIRQSLGNGGSETQLLVSVLRAGRPELLSLTRQRVEEQQ